MHPTISRRQFLGSSFVLCALSSRLFAGNTENTDNIVLRFAAMSDIHYSGRANTPQPGRFQKSLRFMNEYCAKQKYSGFDALLVAGDMTDNGRENQLGPFINDLHAGLTSDTKAVMCMGNHEFWGGGSKPLWEKICAMDANTHTTIKGYHFIALSPEKGTMRSGDYLYARDWVKKELDAAAKDAPGKPIFFIQHYHISETVYGSLKGNDWGVTDLREIYNEYPQLIHFSGHSHFPITDPRSAWQGNFSAFNTGTLSYFEMDSGKYNKFPPGHRNVGQFYIVEVHADNSIILKPYDLITDSFYDVVYIIAEPGNISKYLYTDARYMAAKQPWWKAPSKVHVTDLTPYSGIFHFPQAVDEQMIHSYRLDFERNVNDKWIQDITRHEWSYYFYRNMPENMEIRVTDLAPDSKYRVHITALNCFQKESETKLLAEFNTPPDPEVTVDKNAPAPEADVLNICFTQNGAQNVPQNGLPEQKPVITYGNPKYLHEEKLGTYVAAFNGTEDMLKIKFSANDYSKIRREITFSAKFQVEKFSSNQKNTSIFSNTESGGYSLEINHKNKTLEFWCNIQGRYVILSTPITSGSYHTAFGVYDGHHVILYLNGKEMERKDASGMIHYPTKDPARAFCLGADITSSGTGATFFPGKIAFAQVYSWALTASQILTLSEKK
ncbi:MAG: LamG-like jellyroll fold domain-containing protein [Planctomycetia bacterium]|nr:LamG-like jellyroll fold domain-containing protein [Planctomycetia bacterium]